MPCVKNTGTNPLRAWIAQYTSGSVKTQTKEKTVRMSQEFVDEKMRQLKIWMNQIDEGELTLDVDYVKNTGTNSLRACLHQVPDTLHRASAKQAV